MIEVLDGFPDNVVAYVCHGRIDESDYTRVVADIVDRLVKEYDAAVARPRFAAAEGVIA